MGAKETCDVHSDHYDWIIIIMNELLSRSVNGRTHIEAANLTIIKLKHTGVLLKMERKGKIIMLLREVSALLGMSRHV